MFHCPARNISAGDTDSSDDGAKIQLAGYYTLYNI